MVFKPIGRDGITPFYWDQVEQMGSFTHFDEHGSTRMVDVGSKEWTHRQAIARGRVRMNPETRTAIEAGLASKKGNVLEVARLAGIMASKQTSQLIPLCHPVPIDSVQLDCEWVSAEELEWTATAQATWKTGVEMEALVAVTTACLTVYDMCKAIDKGMTLESIRLVSKTGGKSGEFRRAGEER